MAGMSSDERAILNLLRRYRERPYAADFETVAELSRWATYGAARGTASQGYDEELALKLGHFRRGVWGGPRRRSRRRMCRVHSDATTRTNHLTLVLGDHVLDQP